MVLTQYSKSSKEIIYDTLLEWCINGDFTSHHAIRGNFECNGAHVHMNLRRPPVLAMPLIPTNHMHCSRQRETESWLWQTVPTKHGYPSPPGLGLWQAYICQFSLRWCGKTMNKSWLEWDTRIGLVPTQFHLLLHLWSVFGAPLYYLNISSIVREQHRHFSTGPP